MIDKDLAKQQLARMKGLEFYPQDPEPLKELLNALMYAAKPQYALELVDVWIEQYTDCPKPSEIRRALDAIEQRCEAEYSVQPTLCNDCGDTGYRTVKRLVKGKTYEFAEKCDHRATEEVSR